MYFPPHPQGLYDTDNLIGLADITMSLSQSVDIVGWSVNVYEDAGDGMHRGSQRRAGDLVFGVSVHYP